MTVNHNISVILNNRITWIILIVIGIIIRIALLPVKTGDYIGFLNPWINFIKSHGYASSLKYNFYDYTPSYIYILIGIAKSGFNPLYSVKIVSILFEYVAAFFIGKIAYQRYHSNLIVLISLAVVPLVPTVILNSSYLSQCDSIYAGIIMGSIYFAVKNRQLLSIVFLGIAFAFKLQTVFILPFYFVLMLREKLRWQYFLLIPFIFIVSILPTWHYGRNFEDLLKVYISQTDHYKLLTLNFPNLYIWISNNYYESVKTAGILFTVFITLLSGYLLSRIKKEFSFEIWVKLAFLSAIIVPFILPDMHERYMYLGDLLGVLYFMVTKKNIHLPIGIIIVSFYSYIRCSRYNDVLPMEPAFFVYLFIIFLTTKDFISSLKIESNEITYK
jgi:Gpi18-like mannosyltransferase